MIITYGTIAMRGNIFSNAPMRELSDYERERISALALRCQRRLYRIIKRYNQRHDASMRRILRTSFEPVFDDGFRGEVEGKGGFIGTLDMEAIECNFNITSYQLAYVWRLSRIVKDMLWHYNFSRFFRNGIRYERSQGAFIACPEWQLSERLRKFVMREREIR